ncbi:MAG: signal peptidase I [Deltaproteobacteria bacterium]|nr:MAG: signal peptidase I [Deltaproteobacteria bacterium]
MGKNKSKFQEYVEAIVVALLLALFIRGFIVQAFKIPSGSMIPTLLIGDHILVNKFIYGIRIPFTNKRIFAFKKPEREDVIVFVYPLDPSKDFIKRVIGVEGDTILIKGKKVYINGILYSDPHAHYLDDNLQNCTIKRKNFGPITVPKNSLFVMGDNRDRSYDGRYWNKFVTLDQVIGKAFIIYWSNGSPHHRAAWNLPMKILDAIIYNRWERIGNLIH